jgi:hypothetical protein
MRSYSIHFAGFIAICPYNRKYLTQINPDQRLFWRQVKNWPLASWQASFEDFESLFSSTRALPI